jgi:hypothetical protein
MMVFSSGNYLFGLWMRMEWELRRGSQRIPRRDWGLRGGKEESLMMKRRASGEGVGTRLRWKIVGSKLLRY